VKHLEDCPVEPYIPIYLLVGGCFGLLKVLSMLWMQVRYRRYRTVDDSVDDDDDDDAEPGTDDSRPKSGVSRSKFGGTVWTETSLDGIVTKLGRHIAAEDSRVASLGRTGTVSALIAVASTKEWRL